MILSPSDTSFASDPVRPPGATLRADGRWLTVVSHLDPRYGGLSSVVPQLSSLLTSAHAFDIDLAAFCTKDELYLPESQPHLRTTAWPTSRTQWLRDKSLRNQFHNLVKSVDGVHIHGLWEQSTAIAAPAARAFQKPYILSAHGMLERWALANKRWKKQMYAALFERANVQGAACLHALTHAEAEDYRRFGATCPVAVIPNGVTIPLALDPAPFLEMFPSLYGKRILLFLGRIHFKKGLDLLVQAWSEVASIYPEAHLVLAGPDFEGTRVTLEKLVQEKGLTQSILFTGMLRNELKWSALAAAEGFVLPSYSEGLSVSVLEAMGTGLPVIITEQCNLPEVKKLGTGWEIQSKSGPLASAIRELLSNSPDGNAAIGSRGRHLVLHQYNWSAVSDRMAEIYRWVQGGPYPHTVEIVTK